MWKRCAHAHAESTASASQETALIRKGRELPKLIRQVNKLHSANRSKDAEQLIEAAATTGSSSVAALAKKRAQQLRGELFTYGGLELTRSILRELLKLFEVRLLLPESTRAAQKEAADSQQPARELLHAAARFIHEVLFSNGRRTDDHRNAF